MKTLLVFVFLLATCFAVENFYKAEPSDTTVIGQNEDTEEENTVHSNTVADSPDKSTITKHGTVDGNAERTFEVEKQMAVDTVERSSEDTVERTSEDTVSKNDTNGKSMSEYKNIEESKTNETGGVATGNGPESIKDTVEPIEDTVAAVTVEPSEMGSIKQHAKFEPETKKLHFTGLNEEFGTNGEKYTVEESVGRADSPLNSKRRNKAKSATRAATTTGERAVGDGVEQMKRAAVKREVPPKIECHSDYNQNETINASTCGFTYTIHMKSSDQIICDTKPYPSNSKFVKVPFNANFSIVPSGDGQAIIVSCYCNGELCNEKENADDCISKSIENNQYENPNIERSLLNETVNCITGKDLDQLTTTTTTSTSAPSPKATSTQIPLVALVLTISKLLAQF